jgi:hypothetical protein
LRDLWLHDNQLSGAIPDLSTLSNLESLHLGSNQLSGSIPDLSALTSLLGLDLQDNQLSGPIPDLSTLISLQQLNLYNNQLSSSIPDLSALTNLQQLRLENNQLSGSVPVSVCQVLSHVNIGYNKLEVDTAVPCVDTVDPDWKDTQTVPPTNVRAVPVSATEVKLTWNAIIYTQDGGNYSVWGKEQHDPTYTLMVTTTNKTITGTVVVGLQPGTTYDFVIRTFTPAHGDQQNDLTSVDSGRVTAVTTRFFAVYLPTISNPYSFEAVTINETQIPGRPIIVMGEVFYTTTANIGANLPPDGTFYLSSSTNTPVAAAVDDEVVILLNGTELFSFTYGQLGSGVTPALVEVPRSVMQQIAGETVTIEFRDVYGVIVAATVMYLIWSP